MKTINILIVVVLIAGLASIAGLWGAKQSLEGRAQQQIASLLEEISAHKELQAKLLNSTKVVYEQQNNNNKDMGGHLFSNLLPLMTSAMLPSAIRLNRGAAEILGLAGDKERAAAERLVRVLYEQGVEAGIWTVIAPGATKFAVGVKMPEGGYKYLDPADGVAAMYQNQVIVGPYAARYLIVDGMDYRKVFVPLTEGADISFYEGFAHSMLAPPGQPLYVSLAAPVFEEPLILGDIDGDSDDVAKASEDIDLTGYVDYIGQKHGGNIRRSLHFTEGAKITFILAEKYTPKKMSANIEPQIDGKKLVFHVPENEVLILEDKPGPHIPVDQIIIERL